jgi:DNA topoisomerase VI subunit B
MVEVVLERTTFHTSRLVEFFTEHELQRHIGFGKALWALALLKELIDNALDACEAAGVAPELDVLVEADALTVHDNGPGLPRATLERSLDYLVRVSNKSYYVSPTRGRLGNALKCVWAAPYVVDGAQGHVEVTTDGMTHHIAVTLDRMAQRPVVQHTVSAAGFVTYGTSLTMYWPEIAGWLRPVDNGNPATFYNIDDLLRCYAVLNPHVTVRYTDPTGRIDHWPAPAPQWTKWMPSRPTSPHWYTVETLRALLAAYVVEDRAAGRTRSVREVVAEFAGLKGTRKQKAVTEAAALGVKTIAGLVEDGDIAEEPVRALLTAMQQGSRPIKAKELGILGKEHVTTFLVQHMQMAAASVQYKKCEGMVDGVPYVVEMACAWSTEASRAGGRALLIGVNWSPALTDPVPELPLLLGEARVDSFDPVVVVLHLVCPRVAYTDQGKTTLALPAEIARALRTAVKAVTKPWTHLKRQADREHRVRQREMAHWFTRQGQRQLSVKAATARVMEQAYLQASGNGTYPANARQIMYAARPLVLEMTGGTCWKDASYFTQQLLPDFLEEHPDLTATWDVVYYLYHYFKELGSSSSNKCPREGYVAHGHSSDSIGYADSTI